MVREDESAGGQMISKMSRQSVRYAGKGEPAIRANAEIILRNGGSGSLREALFSGHQRSRYSDLIARSNVCISIENEAKEALRHRQNFACSTFDAR